MYKGVFLDLDGTTLNSSREISSKTIETLRRLNKKGFRIVIATGRSSSSVFPYFDTLNFEFGQYF
jgi:HAD superfamily hydrolase (TIGR01484 family)